MANVVVTVEYNQNQRKDLALPMDVPCRQLAVAMARVLNVENQFEEGFTLIEVDAAGSRRLHSNATLAESGVVHGRVLGLVSERLKEARAVPQGGASLLTTDGETIRLNGAYTLIGRRDPKHNILPDLDLTDLDSGKIASRRHASIEYDQKGYKISDEGSSNGTWVNGERLAPRSSQALQDGDQIVFGRNGVKVTFKRG